MPGLGTPNPYGLVAMSVLVGMLLTVTIGAAQESRAAVRVSASSFDVTREVYPQFFPTYDDTTGISGLVRSVAVKLIDPALNLRSPLFLDAGKALVVYTLRDDLTWRDGTSITAYDALLGYEIALRITSGRPIDIATTLVGWGRRTWAVTVTGEYELTVVMSDATCGAAEEFANFAVLPAHAIDSAFVITARRAFDNASSDDPVALYRLYEQWVNERDPDLVRASSARDPELLSLSPRVEPVFDSAIDETRLLFGDVPVSVQTPFDETNAFLSGDLDAIVNPPYARRADLRAIPGVQISETVGRTWYSLAYNFADPAQPQPAFDPDSGDALDQGVHPIFGNPGVRDALALALDIDVLGEAATSGHFTPMSDPVVPWLPSAQTTAVESNAFAAGEQLEALGWGDWNRDGIRECHGCGTTDDGRPLAFGIEYDSNDGVQEIMVRLMVAQFRQIGAEVYASGADMNTLVFRLRSQEFDAFILASYQRDPVALDRAPLFRRAADIIDENQLEISNVMSYYNADVEAAFDRAAVCDPDTRFPALNDAYDLILREQAIVPLFAVNDFYAVQGAVIGFAPRGRDPFWNIETWRLDR